MTIIISANFIKRFSSRQYKTKNWSMGHESMKALRTLTITQLTEKENLVENLEYIGCSIKLYHLNTYRKLIIHRKRREQEQIKCPIDQQNHNLSLSSSSKTKSLVI